MRDSQKLITFRKAIWRARDFLGLSAINYPEIHYRLARHSEETSFTFPWGTLQAVNLGQVASQFYEIFIQRQYAFLSDSKNPVIIDCGGNVGLSAIWFKLNYPKCDLTVYEADPTLAALIRSNLMTAGIKDVKVKTEAVWVANQTVHFDRKGDDSGRIKEGEGEQAMAIDLACHLPNRVDLLKMDIEGAEFSVLKHLCQTDSIQKIRLLVCEFHLWRDRSDQFIEVLQLLRKSGMQFSITAVVSSSIGLADKPSRFESIGSNQGLLELFAWREAF